MKKLNYKIAHSVIASLMIFSCLLLAGCQTNPSNSDGTARVDGRMGAAKAMPANEWLSQSEMPQVVDRTLTAAEAAYVLRKVGESPRVSRRPVGLSHSVVAV